MKNRFLILFVLAATLFACSSDSMISDDFNKKAVERSFEINNVEGIFTVGGVPSCTDNASLLAEGAGILKYLGKSTLVEQWCWSGAPSEVGERSIIITAANGDELWGFHNSVEWTSANSFVETLTFQGGTGRFENAEGELTEYVEIEYNSPNTGTFVLSGEGTLKY